MTASFHFRVALKGKTGKTTALPRFYKDGCSCSSAEVLPVWNFLCRPCISCSIKVSVTASERCIPIVQILSPHDLRRGFVKKFWNIIVIVIIIVIDFFITLPSIVLKGKTVNHYDYDVSKFLNMFCPLNNSKWFQITPNGFNWDHLEPFK